ncbi:divalent metal cation transporter [Akkermansiaceae bacterium]|nr:divalent metal cation transporter [Akkermansiaceae bacterium]
MIKRLKELIGKIGPTIIVAAVVLGPGSILTSSRVGADFGFPAWFVLALSTFLMIGMVALAARLGVTYQRSLCEELAARLGRGASLFVGLVLFLVVALFQSSNNLAIIAGLEPLVEDVGDGSLLAGTGSRVTVLVVINLFVVFCLFRVRSLYSQIERLMKILVLVMICAFTGNLIVVLFGALGSESIQSSTNEKRDLIPLLGMIGTTFSIGGAFYQGYLVREKGWTLADWKRGLADSIFGICVLGAVTSFILITSVLTFHGRADAIELKSVGDVARQLEPLFGKGAKVIFSFGIMAGAFSSFLINAVIGGTILSDSLGKGWRLSDAMPRVLTCLALVIGMGVASWSLSGASGTVTLITVAQALTVLGLPMLAAALLYLGTRKELVGDKKIPGWILGACWLGFVVACVLAVKTALTVWGKAFA